MDWLKYSLTGAVSAIVSSLIVSIIFACFFRFPVFLGGYIGPFGEFRINKIDVLELFHSVILTWLIYGLLGGFIVLGLCGMLTGIIIGNIHSDKKTNKHKMIIAYSALISLIPVFVLSILDYIIGPW